jgi:hypothetical protein
VAKRLGQQIFAATAVIMGTAIGILTVGLGLGLLGSPWELHFSAYHAAAVAVALVGLTVVSIGVLIVVDLLSGETRPHRRHRE